MYTIARAERDGTSAETRFRLSSKRTSPFKSVVVPVQSTAGSRGVRVSLSDAGYTTFGDGVGVLATHSIRKFPLHFPSRASPCATRFRKSSTNVCYSPTNAQVIVLKRTLKFTLKYLRHVSVQLNHLQGAHYPCLLNLRFYIPKCL